MKPEELQIGNWVTSKKWIDYPFRLTRINDNGKFYYGVTVDNSQVGPFFINELCPIPITPSIFEKNGFVIKRNWAQLGNFGCSPLIMWHFKDDVTTRDFRHELEIHQLDTGKVHIRIQCDYVHQLQQAMRLCGIEKEITLN